MIVRFDRMFFYSFWCVSVTGGKHAYIL